MAQRSNSQIRLCRFDTTPSCYPQVKINKTKGLKLHRGRSSFYQCLPFYPVYLMNLSFAPYTFLPNLPFYTVYLSNLSFAPCNFIPSLPIKPITHSIYPVISILPCYPVNLLNLSFAPSTFLLSLPIEPIIRSI